MAETLIFPMELLCGRQVRAEPLSGLLDLQGSFLLPSPDGVCGQGVQVALPEAPADLQFGRYSPRGSQVAALVPSASPRIAWLSGLWASHLVVCSGPKVPCGLLLQTRVTSGDLLGLPGPADSQLLSLHLARGGRSENVPWARHTGIPLSSISTSHFCICLVFQWEPPR